MKFIDNFGLVIDFVTLLWPSFTKSFISIIIATKQLIIDSSSL